MNNGVILSGWGSVNNDEKTSTKLQHTQLIIENQTLCYNKYDTNNFDYILQLEPVLPDLIQPNLICATSEVHVMYKINSLRHALNNGFSLSIF